MRHRVLARGRLVHLRHLCGERLGIRTWQSPTHLQTARLTPLVILSPRALSVPLAGCYWLLTTCSLLTAHCSLLTAYCLLLTAYCLLPSVPGGAAASAPRRAAPLPSRTRAQATPRRA
eukprot:scaffold68401_cov52-Phaeocystis_antarctica.AAC.2